jgi:uncharacterized protein (DUF2336 family)
MESGSPLSLENLTHFGLRAGVDMRPTLLRVLTDLYVQKLTHRPDEEQHYTELALRLLSAVDVPTRVAVARRLSRHLSPPLRVIQQLAADMPEVAAVVRRHPLLQRRDEAHTVAERDEAYTVADQVLPVSGTRELAAPQQRDDEFRPAAPVPGMIGAAVASELNELFFAATADERRLILLNLEIAAPVPAGRVQFPRDAAASQRLEAAALARNREEFAQHLAQLLQIPRVQARRITADDLGEPIVTAAKALNVSRDVVYRILLFVNSTIGHSVERVHALAALYDEMSMAAAEHMVAIWQALHGNERTVAQHRPLSWNDERSRARTATDAVRRAPIAQRPRERRDAS